MQDFQLMVEFLGDRREALLSLDKGKVASYARKWGVPTLVRLLLRFDWFFLLFVHMARTASSDLPLSARQQSARWLTEQGIEPARESEMR